MKYSHRAFNAIGIGLALAVSAVMPISDGHAASGCYYGDGPFNDGASPPSIRNGARAIGIDVYIDQTFLDLSYPYGLPQVVARSIVEQWTPEIQSRLGSSFYLRYRGTTEDMVCCPYGSSDPDCTDFPWPTIVIFGQHSTTTMFAGGERWPDPWDDLYCGKIGVGEWDEASSDPLRPRKMRKALWHELMHVLHYQHQDAASCDADWQDDDSVVLENWGTSDVHMYATQADIRNIRSAYGTVYDADVGGTFPGHKAVRQISNNFASTSWGSSVDLTNTDILSPIAAAEGDTHAEAYAFLRGYNELQSKVYAKLYQNGSWTSTLSVSTVTTYHPVDIARSTGQATDRWLVAMLRNDTRENSDKDLYFRERSMGAASWSGTTQINTNLTTTASVSLGFDPIRDRFIVAYLDDDWNAAFRTRDVAGGAWTAATVVTGPFYGGVDIACSPVDNSYTEHNCIAATQFNGSWQSVPSIRAYAFSLDANGALSLGMNTFIVAPVSLPVRVVANPVNADPQFTLSYISTAASDSPRELRTKTLSRSTFIWVDGSTTTLPSSDNLYPVSLVPPGLGAHRYNATTYMQLGTTAAQQ